MSKILCATRGGEASFRTQQQAIQRAKEENKTLLFFYVVDVEFMARANYGMRTDVVNKAMSDMGEFLLTMAVERAQEADVEAEYRLGKGQFIPALEKILESEAISLIVLGRPVEEKGSIFKLEGLKAFAADIRQKTGVDVWIP